MTGRLTSRAIVTSPLDQQPWRAFKAAGPQPATDDLPSPRRCAETSGAAAYPLQSRESTAFLRRLVHDLRGPAQAMVDIPDWLREDFDAAATEFPETSAKLLSLLAENSSRLEAILSGLADWVCSGDPPGDADPAHDPNALLSALPAADGCLLRLDLTPPPIAAEDLALIATKVFENAAQFHPARPVVRVSNHVEAAWHVLVFSDDGAGPAVADPDRLLAPMARAPVGPKRPGAGFGLAIVDRVVRRQGGLVRFCHGAEGQGAELVVVLPR